MSRWPGKSEFFRRLIVAGLVIFTLSMIGYWPWWAVIILAALSIATYIYFPRPRPPSGAYTYGSFDAQAGPDWMGFIMSGLFFTIPIWAARSEPVFGTIHPSAVLVWPMALLTSWLWLIGYSYASFWVQVGRKELIVQSAGSRRVVAYDNIKAVTGYRKGLPRWIRALAPLLILSGKYGAAGSVMVARRSNGITLVLKNGPPVAIASDSFDEGMKAILEALEAHGVKTK